LGCARGAHWDGESAAVPFCLGRSDVATGDRSVAPGGGAGAVEGALRKRGGRIARKGHRPSGLFIFNEAPPKMLSHVASFASFL
jgi:hypothetical protein